MTQRATFDLEGSPTYKGADLAGRKTVKNLYDDACKISEEENKLLLGLVAVTLKGGRLVGWGFLKKLSAKLRKWQFVTPSIIKRE